MSELKGCPLCGRAPAVREPSDSDGFAIHVHCRCGLTLMGEKRHFVSAAEAITAWNTRPAPSEEDVEAAAKRMCWDIAAHSADGLTYGQIERRANARWKRKAHIYRRMARAALGARGEG